MHAALIVPAPFDAVSGGYSYDRRIVAGLRDAGHRVARDRAGRRASDHRRLRPRRSLRSVGQHRRRRAANH